MLDLPQKILLQAIFHYRKTKFNVEFSNNEIKFAKLDTAIVKYVIPIDTIITIHCKENIGKKPKKFIIKYAKRKKKNQWKFSSITLNHSDAAIISTWVETLQNCLKDLAYRPKRILLCVNPYGGKKVGMKVYKRIVKPLFSIAKIEIDIFVSRKRNEIRDYVFEHNFRDIDAVVCIGGDGTVSELLNGLVLRECRLQEIDPNTAKRLPKIKIPIGIIPSGSTDCTIYCIHGTLDPKTAALHIMMGKSVGVDLVAAYCQDHLVQIYADIASYGYLGDVVYHSENLRWMGPSRYEYTGFKKIMVNQGYRGKLIILSDETECALEKCYENCQVCSINKKCLTNNGSPSSRWRTVEGKFFLIAGANISCAGERNPNGLLPYCHLGDGYLNLLVIRHTSFFTSLRTLQRFTRSSFSINDLAHVDIYKAKEFYFYSEGTSSKWSCDGEVIHHSNIRAKVQHQIVNIFGRGIPNPNK